MIRWRTGGSHYYFSKDDDFFRLTIDFMDYSWGARLTHISNFESSNAKNTVWVTEMIKRLNLIMFPLTYGLFFLFILMLYFIVVTFLSLNLLGLFFSIAILFASHKLSKISSEKALRWILEKQPKKHHFKLIENAEDIDDQVAFARFVQSIEDR